jgi:RNA polymerase sigma factor (TIGR02999 family)
MSDVTQILRQIEAGDPAAASQLLPLVYAELRKLAAAKMAGERPDHTLQATALVHEAYIRLVDADQPWEGRAHFYAAAANSMRQILVNWAHSKQASKRGGDRQRVDMNELTLVDEASPDLILELDALLTRLAEADGEAAELVKLRLFGGLSVTEAGQALGLSRSVAYEHWQFARAWFSAHWSDRGEK